jgi:hypothetical protein
MYTAASVCRMLQVLAQHFASLKLQAVGGEGGQAFNEGLQDAGAVAAQQPPTLSATYSSLPPLVCANSSTSCMERAWPVANALIKK